MNDAYSVVIVTRDSARERFKAAMNHAAAMLDNGENVLLSVGPALEPIGKKQRRFLHGPVLSQISQQAKVAGDRFTVDIWKEHFRRLFVGANGFRWESIKLPGAKHATPRRIRISTEELGVRAYAEFIEKVIQYAVTELGVEFLFTSEERELIARKPNTAEGKRHAPV